MSLPCFKPLASTLIGQKLPLHKPSSIHHDDKPSLTKLYPSRRRVARMPINMALTTTDEQGITRRIGNHHPNLWDHDFLQSLPKSYDAPCYGERAEKVIKEIKGMFNALHLNSSSADDLYKRLSMVDDVERLGIDRHFQTEIKAALDYVYRYWDDMNGIGCGRESPCADLNTTALGFRILRLHRYGVSSGMLLQFKDNDGQFLCSNTLSNEELRSILNLYRASLIAFPKEQDLDDAKAFSTKYLKQVLPNINNTNISKEIKYNLEYGWHTNVPRLEARTYIDIYGDAKTTNNIYNSKLLELAKLDFNMIQSIQQRELQIVSRWDLAFMEALPEFMKVAFKAFDEGVRSMAQEAEKTQERDKLNYARKAWEICIDSFMVEATWIATGYIPSLEEYLENGKVSFGYRVVTLQPLLSLDVPINDDIIKEIDYPSKFNDLLCLTLRLRGDTKTFKAEVDRGELASGIACYLKDNPRSTEEDALEYLNSLIDEKLKELNWEYLKPDNVPIISKYHKYALSKGIQLLYKERDGISVSDIQTKKLITKAMIEPVPI
ncbi:alpha pinene synthase, chloroplastic-like isoform X2 [Cryptomeria japonica]|uniref:alpha pinene synthase, chloroplastic-like isoform X2 n=1 Tax=Cryptomeria japonica TaxID=3369 RepID=UPI0027DA3E1A|nr:alpha pinene synthase, chloroplastic-like isoform X2 [Cryptomeria japonica]